MAATAMAQDLITCDMCETSPVQMHCNSCATNLCNGCVAKHISADTNKDHHDVVLYKKKKIKTVFPRCKTHKEQSCEMKCRQCDIPVCIQCLSSGIHIKHNLLVLLELFNSQKDTIKKKTTELETLTYPKYEKAVSEVKIQLQTRPQTYDRLMSEIDDQGEEWHREVDIIINRCKQEVEKMKTDDLATLKKLLEEMKNLLSTIHQAIMENNEILESANITQVLDSKYTSPEMWDPPPSIDVTQPIFTPLPIQGKQLHKMFGTLTAASTPIPSTLITPPIQGKQLHQMNTISSPLSFIQSVEDKLATLTNQKNLTPSRQTITSDSPDDMMDSRKISQTKEITIKPEMTFDKFTAHKDVHVSEDGKVFKNSISERQIGEVPLQKYRLKKYKGATTTTGLRFPGRFYYAIKMNIKIKKPLDKSNLVSELGIARKSAIDKSLVVEGEKYAWSMIFAHHVDCDAICLHIAHNNQLLYHQVLVKNATGRTMERTFGFILDTNFGQWKVFDEHVKKEICVVEGMDCSKMLYPVIAGYNPSSVEVTATIVAV